MLTLVKILLGFLIFLILIVSIILFYPVSYRFFLEKGEEIFNFKCKLYWLAGLLSCDYFYPDPGSLQIKLLGIRIFDYNKYMEKQKTKSSAPDTDSSEQSLYDSSDDSDLPDDEISEHKTNVKPKKTGNTSENHNETTDNQKNTTDNQKKASATDKNIGLFEKIELMYKKLKYTLRNLYVKMKKVLSDATFLKELLERENTKGLLNHLKKRLRRLWKHTKPKKLEAYFTVGTGAPDTTGYLMALYGFIFPYLTKRQKVSLNADFENAVLQGTLKIKGSINIFTILINTIAVAVDRRLWEVIDLISKH